MEDFLSNKKLQLPLGSKPQRIITEKWNLLNKQVLRVLRLTLSKNIAHNVAKEKTIMGMMQALAAMYKKPSTNNKVYLMKNLFNLNISEIGLVGEHLNSFNTVVS